MANEVMLRPLSAWRNTVSHLDAGTLLRSLPAESANCIVTSPPYFGLRDYGMTGQIGLEDTLDQYVARLVALFREARRVLREDGTLWLNLGDSYANDGKWGGSTAGLHVRALHGNSDIGRRRRKTGLKPKDLMGIPWRVALALQADGWWLRSDIIWHKPNPMPESVTDRCSVAHEYVFMLSKSERYYYDADAIRTPLQPKTFTAHGCDFLPQKGDRYVRAKNWSDSITERKPKLRQDGSLAGANRRTVWTIPTEPKPFQHYAMFPQALIEPMILAGCPVGGIVLDPFMGSGTTALVAQRLGRHYIGCDLNAEYVDLARRRLAYRGDDSRMVREQAAGVWQLDMFPIP